MSTPQHPHPSTLPVQPQPGSDRPRQEHPSRPYAAGRGAFDRSGLPSWDNYADRMGLVLNGRGTWRTTRCDFHGGSDSMRVNVKSGGWICMACGTKGGDVLAHYMQLTGTDFRTGAQDLGAWRADGTPTSESRLRGFSLRDGLSAIGPELKVCAVVLSDARRGLIPNDTDWRRFLEAAAIVLRLAVEATKS